MWKGVVVADSRRAGRLCCSAAGRAVTNLIEGRAQRWWRRSTTKHVTKSGNADFSAHALLPICIVGGLVDILNSKFQRNGQKARPACCPDGSCDW